MARATPAPTVTNGSRASQPRAHVSTRWSSPSHREPSLTSSHTWWGIRTQSVRGLRLRRGSRMSSPKEEAERRRSSHTAATST